MNENITVEERLNNLEQNDKNLEHKIDILIKLQKETQGHLWASAEQKPTPVSLENIAFQESQAINYVNNVLIPKTEAKKAEGIVGAEGFWDGAVLNYIKQQAITFIGTTLKELAIKGLVDLSKWLIEQGEKTILHLYNNASAEEKELFKEKVQEVFPDSEILKKLGF